MVGIESADTTTRRRPSYDELERLPGHRAGSGQGERGLRLLGHTDSALRALRGLASGAAIDEFVEWFAGVDKRQARAVLDETEASRTAVAR